MRFSRAFFFAMSLAARKRKRGMEIPIQSIASGRWCCPQSSFILDSLRFNHLFIYNFNYLPDTAGPPPPATLLSLPLFHNSSRSLSPFLHYPSNTIPLLFHYYYQWRIISFSNNSGRLFITPVIASTSSITIYAQTCTHTYTQFEGQTDRITIHFYQF